ncbi:MAG TPA: hypothetical protein VK932_30680 [Kofleriaceae bacterium]|nr:hypothetical protein [Kofleriaceae bacterium]
MYFELARRAKAAGEVDLELRLRGAEQLLRGGHEEGRRALVEVLDQLDLGPPATRAGALARLLWRRAWIRLRGLGPVLRGEEIANGETSPRARLRLEACLVAWTTIALMTTSLSLEYGTRYEALALKTADPRHISQALIIEITIAVMMGGVRARRTTRLMEVLTAIAERSEDPYVLGQQESTRAMIEASLGRWAHGREHAGRAMQILRERCLGMSCETAITATFYFVCVTHMGALGDLVREVLLLLREAEEHRDRFTLAALHSGFTCLVSLIQDRPAAAWQQIERGATLWTEGAEDLRLLSAQLSHTEICLYEGDGAAAYRRIDQDWHRWLASPFVRQGYVRARVLYLHAVAALAAYRPSAPDRRLLRAAARDARSLRAMQLPWTCALARVLDAGVALTFGARARTRAQIERAGAELDAVGMKLHATLARRRLGELDGGAEGAREVAEADAWLAGQGVLAPERLARLYMPEVDPAERAPR